MHSNAVKRRKLGKRLITSSLKYDYKAIRCLHRLCLKSSGRRTDILLANALKASETSCRRLKLGRRLLLTSDAVLPQELPASFRRSGRIAILVLLLVLARTTLASKMWR